MSCKIPTESYRISLARLFGMAFAWKETTRKYNFFVDLKHVNSRIRVATAVVTLLIKQPKQIFQVFVVDITVMLKGEINSLDDFIIESNNLIQYDLFLGQVSATLQFYCVGRFFLPCQATNGRKS